MLLELDADGGAEDGLAEEALPAAHLPLTSTVWPTCVDRSTLGDATSLTVPLSLEADGLADGAAPDGGALELEAPSFFTFVSSKLPACVPAWMQPVIFEPPRSDVADAWPDGYGEAGEEGEGDGVAGGCAGGVCALALTARANMAAKQPAAIFRVIRLPPETRDL